MRGIAKFTLLDKNVHCIQLAYAFYEQAGRRVEGLYSRIARECFEGKRAAKRKVKTDRQRVAGR